MAKPAAPALMSTERQALAAAIESLHAAKLRIEVAKSAMEKLWEERRAIEARQIAAAGAIETAQTAAAAHQVDLAVGRAGTPPISVREARNAATDADDALLANQAATTSLRSQINKDEEYVRGDAVLRAALVVIRESEEAAALLKRVEAAQAELGDAGSAALHLVRSRALPGWLPARDALQFLTQVYSEVLPGAPNGPISLLQFPVQMWRLGSTPSADAWQAAIERLMVDPAAPLPR